MPLNRFLLYLFCIWIAVSAEQLVNQEDLVSGQPTKTPNTTINPTDQAGQSLFPIRLPLKFQEIVPGNYDKLKPPVDTESGHATVYIKLSVLAMRSVNERDMTYEMDVFLHQYWTDGRLNIPSRYQDTRVVLDNKWRKLLWTPDIFFKNARDGKLHDIIIPYTYLIAHNKSDVFLASRLTLKLNCMMDLTSYPHDEQECEVMIMSLTLTKDKLVLMWKDFEITRNILLSQFWVSDMKHGSCDQVYDIGVYSCLVGKIRLSRRLGYFLINKFVPSFLIVLVSFATFWIPPTAYPARVSLTVTSVLTIVTQQLASGSSEPDVSYVMAINIWMMGCITFVFTTLLEYTLIVAMINSSRLKERRRRKHALEEIRKKMKDSPVQLTSFICSSPQNHQDLRASAKSPARSPEQQERPPGYLIDRMSRVLFPAFLAVFTFVYWAIYGRLDVPSTYK